MDGKISFALFGCAAVLAIGACAPAPVAPVETVAAAQIVPTATEESLVAALNAERQKAGKPALAVAPVLSGLAREDSASAATAGQFQSGNVAQLRSRSGYGTVTKFQGTLKDRGAATGKSFVDYWMKDQVSEITDDWDKIGVGISKSADGRLFAVVLLGRAGGFGGGLMTPAAAGVGGL